MISLFSEPPHGPSSQGDVFSLGRALAFVLKIDCSELSADEKLALASVEQVIAGVKSVCYRE